MARVQGDFTNRLKHCLRAVAQLPKYALPRNSESKLSRSAEYGTELHGLQSTVA